MEKRKTCHNRTFVWSWKKENHAFRIFAVYNKDGETQKLQTAEPSGDIEEQSKTSDTSVQAQQQMDAKNSQTEGWERTEQHQQTDEKVLGEFSGQTDSNHVESSHMQTETTQKLEQVTQTDTVEEQKKLDESFVQTEELEQFEQITQTDTAAMNESFMQTETPDIAEQAFQTDTPETHAKHVQAVWQSKAANSQTDIKKFEDIPVQTELELCEQNSQTDPKILSNREVQAEVEVVENVAQTEVKEFADTDVQAEVKMNQKGVQTLKPPVKHRAACTNPMIVIDPEDQCEMEVQTDVMRVIDPTLDREAETQTEYGKVIYPEIMLDNVCQTDDVKVVTLETQVEGGSQTDFVFITHPEDLQENIVQTEEVTILNPDTQVSQETQTNLVWVVGLQQDEHADREVIEASVPSPGQGQAAAQELAGQEQDPAMMQPPSFDMPGETELTELKGSVAHDEKWVQTDPVTIIIGDSSFLLQQLANINKSPEVASQQIPPRRKPGRPSGMEK